MFKKHALKLVVAALFDVALVFIAAMCIKGALEKKINNIPTCNCNLEVTANE